MNESIYHNTKQSEYHSLEGKDIMVLHPHDFRCLKQWGPGFFDEATGRETELTGVVGYVGRKALKLSEVAPQLGRKRLKKFVSENLIEY